MAVEIESGGDQTAPMASESTKDSIASGIQSQFDKVFGNDDESVSGETNESESSPVESSDTSAPAADTTADAPASEVADSGETVTDPKTPATEAAAAKAPTLPAAYRRSLKAMEWTDAEIDEAAGNPSFLTTAAKIHATRNKEVAAWAELGRKTKEQNPAPTPTKDAPTAPALQLFSEAEIKALKETYGEDAGGLIDAMVGKVNPLIAKLTQALPVVEQTQQRAYQAEVEKYTRSIEGFFSSKEMESYKDEYGTDVAKLNDKQLGQRNKVLEYADTLIAGARQQGRALSFDEAMTLAHDANSGGLKETAARKQITSQLQKRANSVTLRPGARAPIAPTGKTVLENRVKGSLSKLFA